MDNAVHSFTGQQTGERILHVVKPHNFAVYFQLAKVYALAAAIALSFFLLTPFFPGLPALGVLFGFVIALVGTLIVLSLQAKNIAYITDRRAVRFEAATPFATNIRSITWDDAAKVKSFAPNFLLKMFMVGKVIIHSKTTVAHHTDPIRQNVVSNDDLDIDNVYYYRDLANYIDKILYLYKHNQAELAGIPPFVAKPKGQRY